MAGFLEPIGGVLYFLFGGIGSAYGVGTHYIGDSDVDYEFWQEGFPVAVLVIALDGFFFWYVGVYLGSFFGVFSMASLDSFFGEDGWGGLRLDVKWGGYPGVAPVRCSAALFNRLLLRVGRYFARRKRNDGN